VHRVERFNNEHPVRSNPLRTTLDIGHDGFNPERSPRAPTHFACSRIPALAERPGVDLQDFRHVGKRLLNLLPRTRINIGVLHREIWR
jgi:hypothetical protein